MMREEIAKENAFLTELLNLEEAPNQKTARVGQEINPETLSGQPLKKSIGKHEESASAKGKQLGYHPNVITRDEFELEFFGSSEPEL